MRRRTKAFSGTTDPQISKREVENRAVARKAAEQGIVLMKNEGVLPLKKSSKTALFGGGAGYMIKGGTGSGDVCVREVVNIYQGLLNAGIEITSREWIESYDAVYKKARQDWKNMILEEAGGVDSPEFFDVYAAHPFKMPTGRKITAGDVKGADTAVYVISRIAGEAADRFEEAGDYYLTEQEKEELDTIAQYCRNIIVVLNVGSQIDLKDILAKAHVKALLNLGQPGMEGGNALAAVLTGAVNPSGKLTDTWAVDYQDFPNAETFSHNNGDVEQEKYEESIYVGYRYFESFGVKPAYPFGFGMSYTDFAIHTDSITAQDNEVAVTVTAENIGDTYAGQEVVQIYAACPQAGLPKEYKRLCAFAKTGLLQPGESEQLTLRFDAKAMSSFDEEKSAWVAEKGRYGIFVGNSSADAVISGVLEVQKDTVIEKVKAICPLKSELTELLRPEDVIESLESAWNQEAEKKGLEAITFMPQEMKKTRIPAGRFDEMAAELTEKLTDEQLTAMVTGEISRESGNQLGSAGVMVPGAAGETCRMLEEEWGVPGISMADGPAGLRLKKEYEVDGKSGQVYDEGFAGACENGLFAKNGKHEGAVTYYQYCTAIPTGSVLAQTWNTALLEETGRAVAAEMQEFGVAWWLAPGMNIHRNPLCGRNFEYYSEDPLVSGAMAAAMTRGVQSVPGVGTTIKHFSCNNQEDNRIGSDSILSERTLREIYLRGFEIAVKTSQPMAIMTSYNLINGIHAANCKDICTIAAREEWDFQGIIMTDWTTTSPRGGSIPWKCMEAGNDLIMPGAESDHINIREALLSGELDREDLKTCVRRLLKLIFQTLGYEECSEYGAQFDGFLEKR